MELQLVPVASLRTERIQRALRSAAALVGLQWILGQSDSLRLRGAHAGLFVRGEVGQAAQLTDARVLRPAAKAAGLGGVTWHQFRHVHSSLLHDLGVPVKFAQQQLGHATVETTLNVYTHTILETHRRAVVDLERVLFPNVPKLADSGKRGGFVIQ